MGREGKTKTQDTKRRQAGYRRTIQILDNDIVYYSSRLTNRKEIYCVFFPYV